MISILENLLLLEMQAFKNLTEAWIFLTMIFPIKVIKQLPKTRKNWRE